MHNQFTILCQPSTLYAAWNIVKAKGAVGGVDGVSAKEFEQQKNNLIPKLADELIHGQWKPYPYLQISIPKKNNSAEERRLGMAAMCDKIVQQAIKMLIEPRLERQFRGNSYAYRPGKGATKAIRRVVAECAKKYQYVLRLDVDDFFDNIVLTDIQYRNMCNRLSPLVVGKDDQVNIYPICSECYARIHYIPLQRPKESTMVVVV